MSVHSKFMVKMPTALYSIIQPPTHMIMCVCMLTFCFKQSTWSVQWYLQSYFMYCCIIVCLSICFSVCPSFRCSYVIIIIYSSVWHLCAFSLRLLVKFFKFHCWLTFSNTVYYNFYYMNACLHINIHMYVHIYTRIYVCTSITIITVLIKSLATESDVVKRFMLSHLRFWFLNSIHQL